MALSESQKTVKLALIHSCLLYYVENADEMEHIAHDYPYIKNCAKKLLKAVEKDKRFNLLYKYEIGPLIQEMSKAIDVIETEVNSL
jgi:hypothetical protein